MKTNEYIIVHHTFVSRNKNPKQFAAVDAFHKRKGWGKIGYQYFIEPDGAVLKGREESEVGAHTKENLMNYRSIGICLTGNFDVEEPTTEQKSALSNLIKMLQAKHSIPDSNVVPHRHFAKYKSCWGSRLPDDILGTLKLEDNVPEWARDEWKWATKNGITNGKFPNEPVTRAEIVVMLNRAFNLLNDLFKK